MKQPRSAAGRCALGSLRSYLIILLAGTIIFFALLSFARRVFIFYAPHLFPLFCFGVSLFWGAIKIMKNKIKYSAPFLASAKIKRLKMNSSSSNFLFLVCSPFSCCCCRPPAKDKRRYIYFIFLFL